MARQIRIDALAQECGVAPREVLRVLIELGHFRYTRFNQQIAEDLAEQVRVGLGPAEPVQRQAVGSDEEDIFARAMSAAGVQPLEAGARPGRSPRKKAKSSKGTKRQEPAPKAAEPAARETTPLPTREPELPTPTVAVEPTAPVPDHPQASSRSGSAEGTARLEELERSVTALEEQLAQSREALARSMAERDAALQQRDAMQQHSGRLLEGLGQGGGEPNSLLGLLQARGLRGLDEAGFALRGLLAAHLLEGSLPLMQVQDGGRLGRVLRDRLVLHCGRQACVAPEGVELVQVPKGRCELCGGLELPRAFQVLSDACLLSGITRLVIVGGRRWQLGWLEAGLDRRLKLRHWSGERPPVEDALDSCLDGAQLVILWDGAELAAGLGDAVRERRPSGLATVTAPSAGAFIEAAVDAIQQLDPSELP
jgi:hypothetical protein